MMYNRQILVEHFDGKRRLDDPELQRQFSLLREQATIDWTRMYDGKDGTITVDDLPNNTLRTRDWQPARSVNYDMPP
jgi:hypothetical protein